MELKLEGYTKREKACNIPLVDSSAEFPKLLIEETECWGCLGAHVTVVVLPDPYNLRTSGGGYTV